MGFFQKDLGLCSPLDLFLERKQSTVLAGQRTEESQEGELVSIPSVENTIEQVEEQDGLSATT